SLTILTHHPPSLPPLPSTTLFRSADTGSAYGPARYTRRHAGSSPSPHPAAGRPALGAPTLDWPVFRAGAGRYEHQPTGRLHDARSEEHTSELQSRGQLVCRLLLEK